MKQPDKVRALFAALLQGSMQRGRSMIATHGNNLEAVDALRPGSDSARNLLAELIEVTMKHLGHSDAADGTRFSKNRRIAGQVAPKLRGDGVS